MNAYFTAVLAAIGSKIGFALVLVVADVILGTAVAIARREFKLERLTDYLQSDGLPLLGWIAAEFINQIPMEFLPPQLQAAIFNGVYATVMAVIGGSVLSHFAAIGVLKTQLRSLGVKTREEG